VLEKRSAAAVSVEDQPDARGELRAAHEMLEEMGVSAFADLVRRELAATGETPAGTPLTPAPS
jgi:hypothetical protein